MTQDVDLKKIASELAHVEATEVVKANNGGNSRVFMVATDEKLFALKQYPDIASDPRDRLTTERHALELMHWHGINSVPQWFAAQPPYALMSWVDGDVITSPKESDIEEAVIFLGTLHHISDRTPHEDMPLASEACLCGQDIANQLEKRVEKLMPVTSEDKRLMNFLSQSFLPAFSKRLMAAKKAMPEFSVPLAENKQTLIAADFGFHNMMRTMDGQIAFIDFEYFGWDDPVKLMCDFLLHPATPLTDSMKQRFYQHCLGIYGEDIAPRFAAYYPLFGLRWTLILLNEFIPARWEARKQARGEADWETVKQEQLAKAENMLTTSVSGAQFL